MCRYSASWLIEPWTGAPAAIHPVKIRFAGSGGLQ
jgi:hypothetical protein